MLDLGEVDTLPQQLPKALVEDTRGDKKNKPAEYSASAIADWVWA